MDIILITIDQNNVFDKDIDFENEKIKNVHFNNYKI